jgi:hypothetical protein
MYHVNDIVQFQTPHGLMGSGRVIAVHGDTVEVEPEGGSGVSGRLIIDGAAIHFPVTLPPIEHLAVLALAVVREATDVLAALPPIAEQVVDARDRLARQEAHLIAVIGRDPSPAILDAYLSDGGADADDGERLRADVIRLVILVEDLLDRGGVRLVEAAQALTRQCAAVRAAMDLPRSDAEPT